MAHSASEGIYGTEGSVTGTVLGAGNNAGTFVSTVNPAVQFGSKTYDASSSSAVFQSGGTINKIRTGAITVDNKIKDINGIAGNDLVPSANGSVVVEQHSNKYATKYEITSMDIHGNVTLSSDTGVDYPLKAGSGTPVDKPADSAKDPYGTPPNFVVLDKNSPSVHSFSSLTKL